MQIIDMNKKLIISLCFLISMLGVSKKRSKKKHPLKQKNTQKKLICQEPTWVKRKQYAQKIIKSFIPE